MTQWNATDLIDLARYPIDQEGAVGNGHRLFIRTNPHFTQDDPDFPAAALWSDL